MPATHQIYEFLPTWHPCALFEGFRNLLDKWKEDIVDEPTDKDAMRIADTAGNINFRDFGQFIPLYPPVRCTRNCGKA